MANLPVCDVPFTIINGVVRCNSTLQQVDLSSLAVVFDPSSLDVTVLLEYFTQGFLIVATFWGIGKGVSLVLSLIRR